MLFTVRILVSSLLTVGCFHKAGTSVKCFMFAPQVCCMGSSAVVCGYLYVVVCVCVCESESDGSACVRACAFHIKSVTSEDCSPPEWCLYGAGKH